MSKLISLLEQQIEESDTTESQIGQQRERNHRYYAMQPLGNEQKGRSHYIDPAVFGAVEDKKSVYSETFLSSRKVVQFSGSNAMESEAKTAYVQRVLRANDYENLFTDGWHNAFVAKRMTVWADWRRDREEITLQFLGAPTQMVNQRLQQLGNIVNVNREGLQSNPIPSIGPQQQFVHTGTLVVEIDTSYIALDLIQPELVFRDPCQAYSKHAGWNACRMDMTKLEMINRGYDPDQVEALNPDYRRGSVNEDDARKAHDNSARVYNTGLNSSRTGDQEEVQLYKTRTWLSPREINEQVEGLTPESGPAIYEIHWANGKVLYWSDGTPAAKVLDEMDVFEWTEHKIAHAANGLCTSDVEVHKQKAGSALKRGVMDNMYITNNPGYEANVEGIRDMRDLYDGVIAPIVELETGYMPGQIKALDQPQLSPLVFGVMQMLDQDSEERSGMSQLSRGLNQEVISNQNAENMVDKVAARGERRVAMGVRSFANTFLISLLQCIVRLGMKHDKSQDVMESGGRKIPIAPSQWQDNDHEMEVEVALTPQEAQDMSLKLLGMDAKLAQDPQMGLLYGITQKHALYDTVFELMGIKDSTKFLGSPEDPKVQKQARQQAQQTHHQQMKQDQMIQANMKFQGDQNARAWAALNNELMDTMADNQREDDKLSWENYFKQEELSLEEEQHRAVGLEG